MKGVADFFSAKSDYDTRLAIVRKYGCRHILISIDNSASQEIIESFMSLGSVMYEDMELVLLSFAPRHAGPDSSGIASFDCANSPSIKE